MTNSLKLKLSEVLELHAEIFGFSNKSTGEVIIKGLLSQDLSLVTKFRLSELGDSLSKHKLNVDKLHDEIVISKGEKKDDGYLIAHTIKVKDLDGKENDVINPAFLEYQKEYQDLLNEEKDIEVYDFNIEDFDIKTTDRYDTFFKVLSLIK
jgi:hypothetical protein